MRNAIFYIESLEMLLAESEKDEEIENAEKEDNARNRKDVTQGESRKVLDESVTSLNALSHKKYQSKIKFI